MHSVYIKFESTTMYIYMYMMYIYIYMMYMYIYMDMIVVALTKLLVNGRFRETARPKEISETPNFVYFNCRSA